MEQGTTAAITLLDLLTECDDSEFSLIFICLSPFPTFFSQNLFSIKLIFSQPRRLPSVYTDKGSKGPPPLSPPMARPQKAMAVSFPPLFIFCHHSNFFLTTSFFN
jgi:hypothetical protein